MELRRIIDCRVRFVAARPEIDVRPLMSLFDNRAFQTWRDILIGATVIAGLFFAVMLLVEEVVGPGRLPSKAAITLALAAFLVYVGTAWILRLDAP